MPTHGMPLLQCISCPVCVKLFDEKQYRPISLVCGHTVCKSCVKNRLKDNKCPFDQVVLPSEVDQLPANFALMDVMGAAMPEEREAPSRDVIDNQKLYEQARRCIEEMAIHLRPLAENLSDDDEDSSMSSSEDNSTLNDDSDTCSRAGPDLIADVEETERADTDTKTAGSINNKSRDNMCHSEHTLSAETENTKVNSSRRNSTRKNESRLNTSHSKISRTEGKKTSETSGKKSLSYTLSNSCANKRNSVPGVAVSQQQKCMLSRPMQRKLISLVHCQLLEEEGRSRAARMARSLGERVVSELLVHHQFPHQLSSNLWAAVRTRGCQFLGPAMQEEVLKLILLALEDGSPLSRKVLVLFVVQKLELRYPQASKTAIGHVVQLLYRASCFKVQKRDGESSLMQLKEEFCQYDSLRREHDAQIVQIALEAGLRISPEQWSSLLYGDVAHKPHMQSIIDKLQCPQSFAQNISELMMQKNLESSSLLRLRPHLEFLSNIDPSPDCPAPSWENLGAVMRSLNTVLSVFVEHQACQDSQSYGRGGGGGSGGGGLVPQSDTFAAPAHTRYKTSMCRDNVSRGFCPRGDTCTFAHSQEELEKYRLRSRKQANRGGYQQQQQHHHIEKMLPETIHLQQLEKGEQGYLRPGTTFTVPPPPFQRNGAIPLSEPHTLPEEQSFINAVNKVSLSGVDVSRKAQLNAPTTRLTFSRPALDEGQKLSRVSPLNQQASLHPNSPLVQGVIPTAQGQHPVALAGPPPLIQPHNDGGPASLHQHQQQHLSECVVPQVLPAAPTPAYTGGHLYCPDDAMHVLASGDAYALQPGMAPVLDPSQQPNVIISFPYQNFLFPPGGASSPAGPPAPLVVHMPVVLADLYDNQQPVAIAEVPPLALLAVSQQ